MKGGERLAIERIIAGAVLEQESALRAVVHVLPDHPFRSHEATELEKILVWSAGMLAKGYYSMDNVDVLLKAMQEMDWPKGWLQSERIGYLELLWSPLSHNTDAITELSEALRIEDEAFDALVAARGRFQDKPWVLAAITDETSPTPTRRTSAKLLPPGVPPSRFVGGYEV